MSCMDSDAIFSIVSISFVQDSVSKALPKSTKSDKQCIFLGKTASNWLLYSSFGIHTDDFVCSYNCSCIPLPFSSNTELRYVGSCWNSFPFLCIGLITIKCRGYFTWCMPFQASRFIAHYKLILILDILNTYNLINISMAAVDSL